MGKQQSVTHSSIRSFSIVPAASYSTQCKECIKYQSIKRSHGLIIAEAGWATGIYRVEKERRFILLACLFQHILKFFKYCSLKKEDLQPHTSKFQIHASLKQLGSVILPQRTRINEQKPKFWLHLRKNSLIIKGV